MVKFFTCNTCGTSRDLWGEWVREYVASGKFATKRWLTERWVTADEAVFRFGVPRYHVVELAGRGTKVDWQPGRTDDDAPQLDAPMFAKLKALKAKQNTFVARQLQREWGLSHVLPTAWDRVLAEDAPFA